MRLLESDGHLTGSARLLLGAVSGVPDSLLARARVLPKHHNWLHFPWFHDRGGGGAFVMGDRIYASRHFFGKAHSTAFLLLLAHEVGHLPQAARFGNSAIGKTLFICWAAGHYLRSAVRHGRHAYRRSRIEQEAERGRWVLRELAVTMAGDPPVEHLGHAESMERWLGKHRKAIAALHAAYPGWHRASS